MRAHPVPSVPAAQRLWIGDAQVDVLLREIRGRAGAGPVRRVTPKAMGVLQELAAQAGQVVTREQLLAAVWPDTLPTDDVLTQAVTQLRKAFRQTCGPDECIQTIAKTGYRLLPEVRVDAEPPASSAAVDELTAESEPPGPAEQPAAAPPRVPPHRRARLWIGMAVFATLAGAIVLAVAWQRPDRHGSAAPAPVAATATPPSAPQIITSAPGAENAPSLSPDGALVAYVAQPPGGEGAAILVQAAGQSQARALTTPPAQADDSAPAWSPDGRELAYRRTWPDGRCELRVVAATGRVERVVAACAPGDAPEFDWSPDGRTLVSGGARAGGRPARLRTLSLADGQWRDVAYSVATGDSDSMPRYRRDGRWIVFVRNSPSGDLWRIPAAGGAAERLTSLRLDLRQWHWLPDGRGVVAAHAVDGAFRLVRIDLPGGQATDLGLDDALQPAIARDRPLLAFVRSRPTYGLHRVRLPAGGPSSHVVEPLLPSSARDVLPAIAPDGRQLLFVSDRSGAQGLWYARLGDADALRMLAGVAPRTRIAPSWSPDSRHALVPALAADGRKILVEVEPATGRVQVLPAPVDDPVQALYTSIAHELLVLASDRSGRQSLVRFDRRSQPWRRLATLDDVSRADIDRGRVVFSRPGRAGLWTADATLDPAGVRVLEAGRPGPVQYRMWDIASDGRIATLMQTQDCAVRLALGAEGRPPSTRCLDTRQRAAINGYSLAPSGDEAFVSLVTTEEADIGLLPLALSGRK